MLLLIAHTNDAGVWVDTAADGVGAAGWLTFLAVVAVIALLCWLGNWAVKRSVSGDEARSSTREQIDRLVDGILQTYRS